MIAPLGSVLPTAEDHQAFLHSLRDDLRNETDTGRILSETTQRLAQHLGVNRAGYGEFADEGEMFLPRNHWIDGTVASIDSPMPFALFGQAITSSHRRGEIWVHASLDEPQVDDQARAICTELGIVAAITVPLIKDGRLVSLLSVQQREPRNWRDDEVDLVAEVAERTWATLERARADEARRRSEALLAAIMDHAPIGIYVKDEAGRFCMVNEEVARLMKRSASDILGHTIAELDPASADDAEAADSAALDARELMVTEHHRPGADRYEHSLAMRFPMHSSSDLGPQLAGFEIDISKLKRTEAELERSREALYQSEKMTALGSLLAGVSHELNNPLSIIVAQAELLELESAGGAAAVRAGKIRHAADRAARIVQTFLSMARQKSPNRASVQLNDLVAAALELNSYGLRANGISVRQDLAPDLPCVVGDADQLHQVIVNLLVNAQQALHGHPGERVILLRTAAQEDPAVVTLTVSDSGPGVPRNLRRRIFEPFFTTKAQDVGTGVGLSFSQGIVEAHQGKLELLDATAGAAFAMMLPVGQVLAEPGKAPVQIRSANHLVRSRTALIIDDEQEIADALADLLTLDGYACRTVQTGEAAKAAIRSASFDLILSDLRMPDIDGPELFEWLREARPELVGSTAFTTGDTLSVASDAFLRSCGRPFMEKPFTREALRRLVQAVEDRKAKEG